MATLTIWILVVAAIIAGWHLFEFLWDRHLFGHRGNGGLVLNLRAKKALALFRDFPDLLLIDVRPPASYEAGHLPQAVNAPFLGETLDGAALAGVSRDRPVLIYCDGGFRSRRALAAIRAEGFHSIRHLHRGLMSWKAAGGPVQSGVGA